MGICLTFDLAVEKTRHSCAIHWNPPSPPFQFVFHGGARLRRRPRLDRCVYREPRRGTWAATVARAPRFVGEAERVSQGGKNDFLSRLLASSVRKPHEDRPFADLDIGISVDEDGNLERGILHVSRQCIRCNGCNG